MSDVPPAPGTGTSPAGGGFLLPILPSGAGLPDPIAIATWHLAVSDTIGSELRHELLALWLFPDAGGVVLLGPAALLEDRVVVARPETFVGQEQLLALEDRVRAAGYASVIAAPIRDQPRDLGLMLLAALQPGQYGPVQAMRLFSLLREFVPPFRRLAERMPVPVERGADSGGPDPDNLVAVVAQVVAQSRSAQELVTGLSAMLHGTLPHDHLDILAPGPRPGSWEWLGADRTRRRWGSSEGLGTEAAGPRGFAVLQERLAHQPVLTVADLSTDRSGLVWPTDPDRRDLHRIHAMMAMELRLAGETVGYLLLGSAAADLYRPADEAALASMADVLAAGVAVLRTRAEVEVLRRTVTAMEGPGGALARLVRLLATVPRFAEATRQAAAIIRETTGARYCRFILRLGPIEAVVVEPGESRPLIDLPLVPVSGSPFAAVLRGEVPLTLRPDGENEELHLPLRIAGRPFGVLSLIGPAGGRLAAVTHVAQQLADVVAPHLELVRREAGAEVRSGS